MKNYLTLFFLLVSIAGFAQVGRESRLYIELKSLDSLLFEQGFNKCNIAAFEDHVSEDLEFFHDQGGLSTTKAAFLQDVKQNICSSPERKPIRKLVPESLQVFPLYDAGELYGAIQKGDHEFFIKEPEKDLYLTSTAKFTHVWILEGEKWLLKRVLSYDHKSPTD